MADYRNHSDVQLVPLLKGGDQEAFTEIYDRYNLVLLQHAYNKLRNREEARDIVQETFTNLWEKRRNLEITQNLSGYLYTAVRNQILNHYAHQQVQEKYQQSMQQFALTYKSTPADERIREKQLEEAILCELEEMPAKMRTVFTLNRIHHLHHKEIAKQLDISERTVSSHITHALKILKTKFGYIFILLIVNIGGI